MPEGSYVAKILWTSAIPLVSSETEIIYTTYILSLSEITKCTMPGNASVLCFYLMPTYALHRLESVCLFVGFLMFLAVLRIILCVSWVSCISQAYTLYFSCFLCLLCLLVSEFYR